MKKLLFLISLWLCVTTAGAQQNERDLYSVAFYNLENLFDTIHDAGKNDLEFLPSRHIGTPQFIHRAPCKRRSSG